MNSIYYNKIINYIFNKKYTILLYVRNIRILTYFCKKKKIFAVKINNNNLKIIIVNSILFKMNNE